MTELPPGSNEKTVKFQERIAKDYLKKTYESGKAALTQPMLVLTFEGGLIK